MSTDTQDPTSEESIDRSGGIDVKATQVDVDVDGDVVGRDKVTVINQPPLKMILFLVGTAALVLAFIVTFLIVASRLPTSVQVSVNSPNLVQGAVAISTTSSPVIVNSPTPTPSDTTTPTTTETASPIVSNTPEPSATDTPLPPTPTATNTPLPTATNAPTTPRLVVDASQPTPTNSPVLPSPTSTPPLPTDTLTFTFTPTSTPTYTPSPTFTPTPSVLILAPQEIVHCTNPPTEPWCTFNTSGSITGVTSFNDLRLYMFVFPVLPGGEGWYIQGYPASIDPDGSWLQGPSFLGDGNHQVDTGHALRIRAALVSANATYNGTPLGQLPGGTFLPALEDIVGWKILSNTVELTVQR